jgi:hypothetical protein
MELMKKSLLAAIVLMSTVASAYGHGVKINYSSYGTSTLTTEEPSNRVILDAAPLLMNGIGIAYERTFLPRLTAGPYFNMFKITGNSNDAGSATFSNDVSTFGVRARYFLSDEADQNGVYVLGGLGMVKISTQANFKDTVSGENSSSSLGGLLGAGYQFIGTRVGHGKMTFNVGGTYATGYAVETQAHSMNGGPTQVDEPKALGSIYVEAGIGYMF